MLYPDFRIQRPKNTKLIGKNSKNTYIYHVTGKVYNKKTKFADDKKRICIGKMIDDTYFIPNDNYFDIYGNEEGLALQENAEHSDTLKIGTFLLIRKVLKDLGLKEILDSIYGESKQRFISDLISYMIVHESSQFQHFPEFMFNHYGACVDIRQDSYISHFLKNEMNLKDIQLSLQAWNQINQEENKRVYISYDSTNMNTASKGIELAEYGHPKIDEGLPQVNLSYVVKQENCRPLFYEVYPGSIIDNSEFEYMIQKTEEYGYKNIGIILDRGYYSKRNIEYLSKYGYILMVKGKNEVVRRCIEKNMIKLKNLEGYLKDHLLACASEKEKLFAKDKEEVYIHIYYDDVRAAEERKVCELGILRMEEELKKLLEKKTVTKDKTVRYESLFKLNFDEYGYFNGYMRNEKKIREVKAHLGFFSILSNVESDAGEVIDIYRNRDPIEKMFMSLKSGFDMDKFGIQSDEALQGKVYLGFLASIVRSEINQKLKELRKKNRKDYTVPAALHALDNIEVTRNTKGTYIRRYALTARQKNILKAFEIDDKYLNEEIKQLNEVYKIKQIS